MSHLHTRSLASLFDVGHMLQTRVSGKDAGEYLESLTTCDLKNLNNGAATLTVFLNDKGGILDDLIITKDDENRYFVVSNAGRRDEDSRLLLERQVKRIVYFLYILITAKYNKDFSNFRKTSRGLVKMCLLISWIL